MTRANSSESTSRGTETASARVTFEKPDLCYAPSGAQGSPTWMTCSHARQRDRVSTGAELDRVCSGQRPTMRQGTTTRSSPAPEHDHFRVL
jgi:hypothetical protein